MNRFFTLLLALALLLCGCSPAFETDESFDSEKLGKTRYALYYLQEDYVHSADRSVYNIERRISEDDLEAIIREYLLGPRNKGSISPFPEGTQLQSLLSEGPLLKVDLGNDFSSLTGIELSVACCALAQTCFSCCEASEVQIYAGSSLLDGQEFISITRGAIMLTDDIDTEEDDVK